MKIRDITETITAGAMGIPTAAPLGKTRRRKKGVGESNYPDNFDSKAFDRYWSSDEEHPDAEDHAHDMAHHFLSTNSMAKAMIKDLKSGDLDPEDRKGFLHDLKSDLSGTISNGLEDYNMAVSSKRADEIALNIMKEIGVL